MTIEGELTAVRAVARRRRTAVAPLDARTLSALGSTLDTSARAIGRVTGKSDSDDSMPPAFVNNVLEKLFGIERYALGRLPFPPGVSLVAIVSAP